MTYGAIPAVIEILIYWIISRHLSRWLITKSPTAGFLVFSIFVVVVVSAVSGILYIGVLTTIIGIDNNLGPSLEGGARGFAFGVVLGGLFLVKFFRATRKDRQMQGMSS